MPEAPKDAFLNDYAERNTTNVILSHMPLLFMPGSFVQNVCVNIKETIVYLSVIYIVPFILCLLL